MTRLTTLAVPRRAHMAKTAMAAGIFIPDYATPAQLKAKVLEQLKAGNEKVATALFNRLIPEDQLELLISEAFTN